MPEDAIQKIEKQDEVKSSLTQQINEFKTEMEKILADSSLPAEEQYQLYLQLFSRYLNFENEKRQPTTVLVKSETLLDEKPENSKSFDWSSSIIDSLPKSKKNKAQSLIDYIKNCPSIDVNTMGEIIINKELIKGSHIVDIVHDFTRERAKSKPPIGAFEFGHALRIYLKNTLVTL